MATENLKPKTTCDLCKAEIDTSKAWPQLWYPFDDTQREQMARALAGRWELPYGNILGIVRQLPPIRYHRFDFCLGCVDGFMPMLEDLRAIAYKAQLAELEGKVKQQIEEPPAPRYE